MISVHVVCLDFSDFNAIQYLKMEPAVSWKSLMVFDRILIVSDSSIR